MKAAYMVIRKLGDNSNIEKAFSSLKKAETYLEQTRDECVKEGWVCMHSTLWYGTPSMVTGLKFKCDKGSDQGFWYIRTLVIE